MDAPHRRLLSMHTLSMDDWMTAPHVLGDYSQLGLTFTHTHTHTVSVFWAHAHRHTNTACVFWALKTSKNPCCQNAEFLHNMLKEVEMRGKDKRVEKKRAE